MGHIGQWFHKVLHVRMCEESFYFLCPMCPICLRVADCRASAMNVI